uniref:WW domain-containing protein n=1 Tax=Neobodo designis TaxID=312471 RepID=A0A7S1PJZ6_NEODS|mmetsp:Transcript_11055/g.34210  ORF Transcript_11055/g.34210 Transcript_11055/m.34210 type:complete len:250 (+) Transcript_11055:62-811(+)
MLRRMAATSWPRCAVVGVSALPSSPCAVPAVGPSSSVRRVLSSESIDAARRLTNPNREYPATGEAPAPDANAARVMWREHWDLLERKPYYHNLVTNETTWRMPAGFPTRFTEFYSQLSEEHAHGMRTADHLNAAHAAATSGTPIPKRTLQQRLADYGPSGFALYFIIHFVGFLLCYALLAFGVDLGSVAHSLGFEVASSSAGTKGATIMGAIALNKLLVPLQILLTVALAPRLTPMLKYGWRRFYYFNH